MELCRKNKTKFFENENDFKLSRNFNKYFI